MVLVAMKYVYSFTMTLKFYHQWFFFGIVEALRAYLKTSYVKLDGDLLCIFGQMITS